MRGVGQPAPLFVAPLPSPVAPCPCPWPPVLARGPGPGGGRPGDAAPKEKGPPVWQAPVPEGEWWAITDLNR